MLVVDCEVDDVLVEVLLLVVVISTQKLGSLVRQPPVPRGRARPINDVNPNGASLVVRTVDGGSVVVGVVVVGPPGREVVEAGTVEVEVCAVVVGPTVVEVVVAGAAPEQES